MLEESHYVVCVRCRAGEYHSPEHVAAKTLCRNQAGEFVVRGARPRGCRICGTTAVEILWGVPRSNIFHWSHWTPSDAARGAPGEASLGPAVGSTSKK